MGHFMRYKEQYALALVLFLVASVGGIVLWNVDRHIFLYFGDAASHIVKARQLIDSQHPGIESIGTVWLPVPHFLLVPFVAINGFFFSGIAGPALGIPCLVGTGVLLFATVRRLTGSASIAFISACLFGLNPNVIYMALTPMNELCLFFFVTLGGYALLRWLADDDHRWLVLCAVSAMLASLCRYEAWLLAAFVALLAAVKGISFWKHSDRNGSVQMIAIGVLSLAGIALWFCWNWFEYGDALQFAPWKYRPGPSDLHTLMSYRQEAVFITLLRAILNVFGPLALLACAVGVLRLKRAIVERRYYWLVAYLSIPALFIFAGILTDFVLIDQWWWNWRFVLIFGLFVSVVGGLGLAEFFKKVQSQIARGVILASLFVMPVVQVTVPSVGVATYEDAAKIFGGLSKEAAAFGEKLRGIYKGGSIVLFTGSGLGERIMVSSWVQLKNYHLLQYPGGQDILGPIRCGDRYVAIGKVHLPDSREVVDYWLARREPFLRYYNIIMEDENYLLLERKSPDELKLVR
jgi:4-amino-4-deoxy-L-arabinose transferase-like glycosyltransferase